VRKTVRGGEGNSARYTSPDSPLQLEEFQLHHSLVFGLECVLQEVRLYG
jgi:hypothetical protein